jgi:hypothetical protein
MKALRRSVILIILCAGSLVVLAAPVPAAAPATRGEVTSQVAGDPILPPPVPFIGRRVV